MEDWPVSEEPLTSKTRPTYSTFSGMLENTVPKQIASTPSSVEDAIVRFFEDVARATA